VKAKRGRGRPKGKTANDQFFRLYLTAMANRTETVSTKKMRRKRLNKLAKQALFEFDEYLDNHFYSGEELSWARWHAKHAYQLMCKEANCGSQEEADKLRQVKQHSMQLTGGGPPSFEDVCAQLRENAGIFPF
jgi:hypothetical protein